MTVLPRRRKPDTSWGFLPAYVGLGIAYVYAAYDHAGRLLYVGRSDTLLERLGRHSRSSTWYSSASRLDIWEFDTTEESVAFERAMITEHQPPHNTMGVTWRHPWAAEPADPLDEPVRTTRGAIGNLIRLGAVTGVFLSQPEQLTLPDELDEAFLRGEARTA